LIFCGILELYGFRRLDPFKTLCQIKPENDPASLYRAMPNRQVMTLGGSPFAKASARQARFRSADYASGS